MISNIGGSKLTLSFISDYSSQGIFAVQGETARKITVQVVNDVGAAVNTTGLTLELYAPDGDNLLKMVGTVVNATEGIYSVKLAQFKRDGLHKAQFVLKSANGKEQINSKMIDLFVETSIANGGAQGQNIIVDYQALVAGVAFLKSIENDIMLKSVYDMTQIGVAHNAIYRGKNLGNSVTAAQYAVIANGRFTNLYIGDYWTINEVNWRIAAFNYYANCGDNKIPLNHIVIVPDRNLYEHKMNDTNTVEGAYVGSKMYKEGLTQAKNIIKSIFGTHVVNKRIYLSNAVSNGKASAGLWTDSEVDLMCEEMVYGTGIFRPTSDGSTVPNNYRVEKHQLPLFAVDPSRINTRQTYWLRDVVSSACFALITGNGNASYASASVSLGVRPAFCIS